MPASDQYFEQWPGAERGGSLPITGEIPSLALPIAMKRFRRRLRRAIPVFDRLRRLLWLRRSGIEMFLIVHPNNFKLFRALALSIVCHRVVSYLAIASFCNQVKTPKQQAP